MNTDLPSIVYQSELLPGERVVTAELLTRSALIVWMGKALLVQFLKKCFIRCLSQERNILCLAYPRYVVSLHTVLS